MNNPPLPSEHLAAGLRASPFLQALPAPFEQALATSAQLSRLDAGATLTVEGQQTDRLVLVLSGEVGYVEGGLAHPEMIVEQGAGEMFGLGPVSGEVELFTASACSPLEIASWPADVLKQLEEDTPGLLAQLATRLSLRGRTRELLRALRQSRLFQGVSSVLIQRLLSRATLAHFPSGAVICRQGDPGDALFHLVGGEATVIQTTESGDVRELATLYTGSTFGEMAVLADAARNASVKACRDSEVLIIGRSEVRATLRESRPFRDALNAIAGERMKGAQARIPQMLWIVARTPFSTATLVSLLAQSLVEKFEARVLTATLVKGDRPSEGSRQGIAHVALPAGDGLRGAFERALRTHGPDYVLFYCDPASGGCEEAAVEGTWLAEALPAALLLSTSSDEPFPHAFWSKNVTQAHVRTARVASSVRTARRGAVRIRLDVRPDALSPSLAEASPGTRAAIERLGRCVARCEVGLALSGGAAWGFAHIPLLRGLQRDQIPIDVIAGISFGSLAGAFLASHGPAGVERIAAAGPELLRIAAFAPITTRGVQRYAERNFEHQTLEELDTTFFPVAVDIDSGRQRVFRTGPMAPAIRASCSLPGIFGPTLYDDSRFVDGCVIGNVPAGCLIDEGADFIIASNIVPAPARRTVTAPTTPWARLVGELSPFGRVRDGIRSLFLLASLTGSQFASEADVTFTPKMDFLPWEFGKSQQIIENAERQVEPTLADVRQRYTALCRGVRGKT